MSKFEEVKKNFLKFQEIETQKPVRADAGSAGYDLRSKENYTLNPGSFHVFWTDIKCQMASNECCEVYTRSGNGTKRGVVLRNGTGIIDSSYYENSANDGNIGVCLYNSGDESFDIHIGDRIAQAIIQNYNVTEDDGWDMKEVTARSGGFGSTGR